MDWAPALKFGKQLVPAQLVAPHLLSTTHRNPRNQYVMSPGPAVGHAPAQPHLRRSEWWVRSKPPTLALTLAYRGRAATLTRHPMTLLRSPPKTRNRHPNPLPALPHCHRLHRSAQRSKRGRSVRGVCARSNPAPPTGPFLIVVFLTAHSSSSPER